MPWHELIPFVLALMYGLNILALAGNWMTRGRRWKGMVHIVNPAVEESWAAGPEFPTVSILVAARNEARNLPRLIPALLAQDYPAAALEFVIVDDDSEDESLSLIHSLGQGRIRSIALKRDEETRRPGFVAFKKRALREGILATSGDLILTTDADCQPPPTWVSAMVDCRAKARACVVAGPVTYLPGRGLLHVFQATDFLTMQGITAGVLRSGAAGMANGANLMFDRAAYEAVGGYDGAMNLASGDDMMLVEKLRRRWPVSLAYCQRREAMVPTEGPDTWRAFLNQRIRWASKNGKYPSFSLTVLLLTVYAFNLNLLILAIGGIWLPEFWNMLCLSMVVKTMSELMLCVGVFGFFRRLHLLLWLVLLQPLHVLYIVVSGFLGMIGRYEWKGRQVR